MTSTAQVSADQIGPTQLDKPTQKDKPGFPGTEDVRGPGDTVITVTRDADGGVVDEVHRNAAGYVVAQLSQPTAVAYPLPSDGGEPAAEVAIVIDRIPYRGHASKKQAKAIAKEAGIDLPKAALDFLEEGGGSKTNVAEAKPGSRTSPGGAVIEPTKQEVAAGKAQQKAGT